MKYYIVLLVMLTALSDSVAQQKKFITVDNLEPIKAILYLNDSRGYRSPFILNAFALPWREHDADIIKNSEVLDSLINSDEKDRYVQLIELYARNRTKKFDFTGITEEINILEKKKLSKEIYEQGFWQFSPPIFLENSTKCLLKYVFTCGTFCSSYTFAYLQVESGKWRVYEVLRLEE